MTTFWNDLMTEVNGESVEAVVVGPFGWDGYQEDERGIGNDSKGRVLTAAQAEPLLNYWYSDGYGAPECHAVWLYTKTRVYFVSQYDGSTSIHSIPRNPTAGLLPEMPGG